MQKKLMISFAVPLICLTVIVTSLCSRTLRREYIEQSQYALVQSGEQVNYYLTRSLENMHYISQLVRQNSEIISIFEEKGKNRNQDTADEYREYFALNELFYKMEMANSGYQIGIYVPESYLYSNNKNFFYPDELLEEYPIYEELMESLEQNQFFHAVIDEMVHINTLYTDVEYLTCFSTMQLSDRTYVTRVTIELEEIEKVLKTAQSVQNQLNYILDENGNFIAASDIEYYKTLQEYLPTDVEEQWREVQIRGTDCYIICRTSDKFGWKIVSLVSAQEFQKQSRVIQRQMQLLILILILAIVLVSQYLSYYYVRRLEKVNRHMKSLEKGELNTMISEEVLHDGEGDEIDAIYMTFNSMSVQLNELMKEHYQLGKKVMSAELKALQAQINPHFLYNTLDMINWGALEHGVDDVASMARNLGLFYRLSLNQGRSAILIEDELKHVDAYIRIEELHFPGALFVETDIDPCVKEYACLNLILQPFVENSIVHGIAEYPDMLEETIKISAYQQNADIIFTIEDDGMGIPQEILASILVSDGKGTGGFGVKNTDFRIKLCYGEEYGVSYESDGETGTRVTVRIPAMTYEELRKLLN